MEPTSMSPRFMAFLRPAYCKASNDLIPLLINLGLVFRPPWEVTKAISLSTTWWWASGGMGCDIHQKVIILFHAFPGYNVPFGSCFGCFYKAKAWDLASKLLIPSALWMLFFSILDAGLFRPLLLAAAPCCDPLRLATGAGDSRGCWG